MKYIDKDGEQPVGWALHAAGAAIVVLVVGAYYFIPYQRLEARGQSDLQRIDQLTTLISESAEVQRQNLDLRQELNALEASVAAIRERLPHEMRREEFTDELNRVAQEVGLHVLELRWGASEVTPSYTQAEVQLECDGSYASVCRFLDEVSQLTRITDIAQLQLEADTESRNHPFQVTFVLYYGVDSHDSDNNKGVL
jgi:Tfp pilus assembly protein PilO